MILANAARFGSRDPDGVSSLVSPNLLNPTLLAGRAGTIFYEPEGAVELGYRRNDIARAVKEIADRTP